jgi:hypothetical protein
MIQNILAKLAAIAGAIIAIFTLGNFFGKKSQQTKQLEENFNDAVESKKRQQARKSDDISDVKRRMQKYIRK